MNDQAQQLAALAAAIARALGATLLPPRKGCDPDQWRRIDTAEGPQLSLHFSTFPKRRLVTGINLPNYTDRAGESRQQTTRDVEWNAKRLLGEGAPFPETSITADAERDPEKLAADIRRRLLPGAIVLHRAALERKAQLEEHGAGTNATVARLCKELKQRTGERKHDRETLYFDACRLQVSSPDSVRFESFYVDTDTAIAIYKLIEAHKAKGGE
jgi:hypothetical protein